MEVCKPQEVNGAQEIRIARPDIGGTGIEPRRAGGSYAGPGCAPAAGGLKTFSIIAGPTYMTLYHRDVNPDLRAVLSP